MNLFSKLPQLAALSSGLLLASCASTMTVSHDVKPGAKFAGPKTYQWMNRPPTTMASTTNRAVDSTFIDQEIVSAVDRQLASKGFQKVASGGTYEVGYAAAAKSTFKARVEDGQYYYPTAAAGRYQDLHTPWLYGGAVSTRVDEYEEGTVVVDIADAKTDELLWRGRVQAKLRDETGKDIASRRIDEAITKILAPFPPQS